MIAQWLVTNTSASELYFACFRICDKTMSVQGLHFTNKRDWWLVWCVHCVFGCGI